MSNRKTGWLAGLFVHGRHMLASLVEVPVSRGRTRPITPLAATYLRGVYVVAGAGLEPAT